MNYPSGMTTKKSNASRAKKFAVLVHLKREEYDRLEEICKERGISRADFLRGAIQSAEKIETPKTRPVTGIAKKRQQARLRREKRASAKGD